MAFEKGHEKKGGRQKGTPNKLTKELRSVLKDFVFEELSNLEDSLNDIDSKERIEIMIKLLPFVLPKINNASYTTDEPLNWDI